MFPFLSSPVMIRALVASSTHSLSHDIVTHSVANIAIEAAAIREGVIVKVPEVAVRLVVVKTMLKPMSLLL